MEFTERKRSRKSQSFKLINQGTHGGRAGIVCVVFLYACGGGEEDFYVNIIGLFQEKNRISLNVFPSSLLSTSCSHSFFPFII